jgi:DNA (cytosine-5)-methyltransferase 1
MLQVDEKSQLSPFHYYYDMKYSLDYSTFSNVEMGEFL